MTRKIAVDLSGTIPGQAATDTNSLLLVRREIRSKTARYTLEVLKRHDGKRPSIFFALRDAAGRAVADLQVRVGRRWLTMHPKAESVVLPRGTLPKRADIRSLMARLGAVVSLTYGRSSTRSRESKQVETALPLLVRRLKPLLQILAGSQSGGRTDTCLSDKQLETAVASGFKGLSEEDVRHVQRPCLYCARQLIAIYEGGRAAVTVRARQKATKQKAATGTQAQLARRGRR